MGIKDLVVYHGTERGGFAKPRPGSFFTTSRAEAVAYTEITDTDADRSIRYLPVVSILGHVAIPERVDWGKSWPDYFDYVGDPNKIAVNGNTGRLFFWDGSMNPVGDKNIVILSGVIAGVDGKDDVSFRATTDDETMTPRVLHRRVFTARLDIRNAIHLPWDEANLLGRRLGADPEAVEKSIGNWLARGYDGVETLSDDGALFGGRKIRQFIPFSSGQIDVLAIEENGGIEFNNMPLPGVVGREANAATR